MPSGVYKNIFRVWRFWPSQCLSPSSVQSFTRSPSCYFPWLSLFDAFTNTHSHTSLSSSLCLSFSHTSLSFSSHSSLSCSPPRSLCWFTFSQALPHPLQYTLSSLALLFYYPIPVLLLLKGYPHLFWSPLIISCCFPSSCMEPAGDRRLYIIIKLCAHFGNLCIKINEIHRN